MNHDDTANGAPEPLTTEEAAELANVLPATPEDAYAEGRKDEREQCIAACMAVMNAYGGDPAGRLLSSERVRMQHQLQASGAAQCIDAIRRA
jgi:hypothetical protein